jgi:hypothetical protein
VLGATDRLAHVARQAVGGDDTEADAGDDADTCWLSRLVEVVKGPKHLQFVADVEVMDSGIDASLSEGGRGMQEWSGGIEYQVHVGQRPLQCARIIQAQNPMRQAETFGKIADGWRAPTGKHGAVTAFESTLRD